MTVATPFHAMFPGIMSVVLPAYVVRLRHSLKAAGRAHGDATLARAVRAPTTFSAYTPFGVALMIAAEFPGTASRLLHGCGILPVPGRALRAAAFAVGGRHFPMQVAGMAATPASLALAGPGAVAFSIV